MKMILSVAAAALLVGTGVAHPEFRMQIPNGLAGSDPSSGISCSPLGHDGCVEGASRNQFGLDFQAAGFKWTKELCETDSDGDGESNGSELGDPCCLWTPDNTNPKGFRVNNLSHPGDASEDGSKSAPKCDESSAPEAPAVVTEAPIETTEAPLVVTEAPVETTEAPVVVTEAPVETTEAPVVVTEAPVEMTEAPVVVSEAAVETTEAPAVVTEAPVKTTEAPAVVNEASVKTTEAPAVLTEAPVKATGAPAIVTESPTETTVMTVTKKAMKPEAITKICSQNNTPCSSDSDCCESTDMCTNALWEGEGAKLCLLRPPVCYKSGERCAGASGYEFVPYAACCDSSQGCTEDKEKGWGMFCNTLPLEYYGDSPAGEEDGSEADVPAVETDAPVEATTYTTVPVESTTTYAEVANADTSTGTTAYATRSGTEAPAVITTTASKDVTQAPAEKDAYAETVTTAPVDTTTYVAEEDTDAAGGMYPSEDVTSAPSQTSMYEAEEMDAGNGDYYA